MIDVSHIRKVYNTGVVETIALDDISFKIKKGEFAAIMGPSGSGKSTLMHILGALDTATSGSYILDGETVGKLTDDELADIRNRKIGFIFQAFNLLPRTSALKNVMLPMRYAGIPYEERIERAKKYLELVGLGNRMDHTSNQLSGGQQQRVAIARGLAMNPSILLADEPTGNIASAQAEEVMALFQDINDQGHTIVMITHEPDIADHAKRVIMVRDGKLVDDKINKKQKRAVKIKESGKHDMNETIAESLSTLTLNKLRTGLAMLGIVIGIGSVIALISLGQATQQQVQSQIQSLGANLLTVSPGSAQGAGGVRSSTTTQTLTIDDANAIAHTPSAVNTVSTVSPEVASRGQVTTAGNNTNVQIIGARAAYATVHKVSIDEGAFITDNDDTVMRKVAVLGPTVATTLFPDGSDPVGRTIRILGQDFTVVGITVSKGGTGFLNQDNLVYVPLSTAQKQLFGQNYLTSIALEASSPDVMVDAENQVGYLLLSRHHLSDPTQADFSIFSQADILNAASSTTGTFTALLSGIAAISLLVGGIGIMNIMLVTVTERTREIGLRKALGARKKTIVTQFLLESVILTFIGGIIGMVCGIAVSYLVSSLTGSPFIISVSAILLAIGVSAGIGILFGWYPAQRAAGLQPIEALRYE